MGGLKKRRFLCATLLFASALAFAECPPQHAELRMAINLGKYDQAREYIKQGVKDIYCGDMPADSAKAVWAKRWKQNPELALTGCLPQYTHFYPEKACEIRGVSPNICPGRLKDSTALADPERFAALAKAALSNPEHKTRLRGEIATLGEERLIALADEARFDFASDSALPEKMAAWAGMLRDLQRKFKLFGDGEKDYYPGSEKWMKSERARERITSYRKRKVAADAGQSEKLLQKAPTRGDTESQTVHILKIVEVVDYTPTGRRIVVYSDGAPTTPQFTGKEMDAETGLYHFGARQYDPELAMWAQVDPGRQFASPYAYAGNGANPINGTDDGSIWRTIEVRNNTIRNILYTLLNRMLHQGRDGFGTGYSNASREELMVGYSKTVIQMWEPDINCPAKDNRYEFGTIRKITQVYTYAESSGLPPNGEYLNPSHGFFWTNVVAKETYEDVGDAEIVPPTGRVEVGEIEDWIDEE